MFVVEAAEGSRSTVMCQGDQDIGPDLTRDRVRGRTRTRAVTSGPEQHAGMSIPHDII